MLRRRVGLNALRVNLQPKGRWSPWVNVLWGGGSGVCSPSLSQEISVGLEPQVPTTISPLVTQCQLSSLPSLCFINWFSHVFCLSVCLGSIETESNGMRLCSMMWWSLQRTQESSLLLLSIISISAMNHQLAVPPNVHTCSHHRSVAGPLPTRRNSTHACSPQSAYGSCCFSLQI